MSIRLPNKTDSLIFITALTSPLILTVIIFIKEMEYIDSRKDYNAPQAEAIEVNAQNVLCQSNGNEPMREYDYGDGGFGNDF